MLTRVPLLLTMISAIAEREGVCDVSLAVDIGAVIVTFIEQELRESEGDLGRPRGGQNR